MSLRAMVAVFERSPATLTNRLVLLALAEYAHDDGGSAFPSIATLSVKARVSERTVQRALRSLEADGEIVKTGTTSRGVSIWHVTAAGPAPRRRGDNLTPEFLDDGSLEGSGDTDVTPAAPAASPGGDNLTPLTPREAYEAGGEILREWKVERARGWLAANNIHPDNVDLIESQLLEEWRLSQADYERVLAEHVENRRTR